MVKTNSTPELTFFKQLQFLKEAGIAKYRQINHPVNHTDGLLTLEERICQALGTFKQTGLKCSEMIYFIMYDIENNKIRTYISKYLEKKGCIRIQKSIFIARNERKVFEEISTTLKKVQEMYDNYDSIFFVPVGTDHLQAMKIIGKNVDFDMILENRNTLFY